MIRPNSSPHHDRRPFLRRPQPPPPSLPPAFPFAVLLRRHSPDLKPLTAMAIERLIDGCLPLPEKFFVYPSGELAAKLFFLSWDDAAAALLFLWRRRLAGDHRLAPTTEKYCLLPAERQPLFLEEEHRLRELFVKFTSAVLDGNIVSNCKQRVSLVKDKISGLEIAMRKRGHRRGQLLDDFIALDKEKKRFGTELELLKGRLEEFRVAISGIIRQLSGEKVEVEEVIDLGNRFNWCQIHSRVLRECRRLGDGLPIYSCRSRILRRLKSNQVLVLVGETGSGKSTQLVQFLADSGLAAKGSIVCTQPRKIAAISLAQRIREESSGCYADDFVISYPTHSYSKVFDSRIIFMTDHCLLQHYTRAKNLDGISYIIVDEAHERSLNTDLLLAVIKKELLQKFDLRLIIMSATADASKLADYFDGCSILHVTGRNFPVDIKYVPDVSSIYARNTVPKPVSGDCALYVSNVIQMVNVIHKTEEPGAILAFLTSQMEVEWACENFNDPSAVVLPMHGKLSHEDQSRVMKIYQDKRKVIFSTNIAETSLTIPGVKYVVDSGMVKDSRFDPSIGMNVLNVGRISQSSANQRAGRAGRTGPGKCYRLFSECDFKSMMMHQEPEIRKVHLGIAVLRILAIGMKNVQDFNFVDAPNQKAIEKAIENLINLGAVVRKHSVFELTDTGLSLVKLGIEPRLGKIILDCFGHGLKKEGLVLAAVMANSSSIFCRVGSNENKCKADCLRVPFCHRGGDLFTLLSVYKEWEAEHESRNQWCWQNSINAKSMRRCQETVNELDSCIRHEINTIIPSYWRWNPHKPTDVDCLLKKVILSSLIENVAMYSGSDLLGYEVAATGQHLQLHPSCSLLICGQTPSWVVFGEILSVTNQYMVCVTPVDYDDVCKVQPALFGVGWLESRMMQMHVISELGNHLLTKFRGDTRYSPSCGKSFCNQSSIVSSIRKDFKDERIDIKVDFDKREIQLFALAKDMEKVICVLTDVLEYEKRLLRGECAEKCLFLGGQGVSPPVALFGSGAEIKHLELDKRSLTVEIFHQDAGKLNDKELLQMFEQHAPGNGIANFSKHSGIGQEGSESSKWGRITFLRPEYAENAVVHMNGMEFQCSLLKVFPVRAVDQKPLPFSAVRARVHWPRRRSRGAAFIICGEGDAESIVDDCFGMALGGRYINCEVSSRLRDCVFLSNIPFDVSETEIYEEVTRMTKRSIFHVQLLKQVASNTASTATCAEALRREIAHFMPNKHYLSQHIQVEVFNPVPKDHIMKAMITFDGSLHLEAAKALDHLQGKVLSGCLPWQKIECEHVFYSSIYFPRRIFDVIKKELDTLLESFKHRKGVNCSLEKTITGSYRIKISANATKIVADLRKPVEKLTKGKTIKHPSLTQTILKLLISREGFRILHSVQDETKTYIFYDRRTFSVRIFGPPSSIAAAEEKLLQELSALHESKLLEIHLRGHNLPPDLMKELVRKFSADLGGLREMVPGGIELSLDTRRHTLHVKGTKEQKQQVEEIIQGVAASLANVPTPEASLSLSSSSSSVLSECPICLCELEEPYKLEECGHDFCRACLVDQCDSAAHSRDGFPLRCTKLGCGQPFLLVDLKSLLPSDKLEELFRASLVAFVASSAGKYRFCPSPDCPAVYRVADEDQPVESVGPFVCGACSAETCTKCHLEYHPFISCELYQKYKDGPDHSLMEWRKGKQHVKDCPSCGHTIEKAVGCNHITCRCGIHICWVCLEFFKDSNQCYIHLKDENHG